MKFQYFTYFLNPISQEKLFEDKRNKKEILRDVLLNKEIEYKIQAGRLAFVAVNTQNDFIIARLGKRTSLKKNLPPENKFEEQYEENWPYCTVIFNISQDSQNGQKIAFELKTSVFTSPYQQLKNLADELNSSLISSGWAIAINPIVEEREFWKLVEENNEKIKRLTFSFNSPNLFNLDNSLNEDLMSLQKDYSTTKVTIGLENPDGKLKIPQNDLTKQGIEYIARGGGEYSLEIKGKRRRVFKSKNNIVTREVEDLDFYLESNKKETLFAAIDRIFKW